MLVGAISLALGLWALVGEIPSIGLAAGIVGLIAGLTALVHDGPTADRQGEHAGASSVPLRPDGVEPPMGPRSPPPPGVHPFPPTVVDTTGPVPRWPDGAERADGAGEPGTPTGDVPGSEALTDPVTELFSEAYMRVALDSRLAAARRHLRPVSLIILEATQGTPEGGSPMATPANVADAIRRTVREADTACRLDDGTFAVILEDTPENGAVWTVERIRRNLVSHSGQHTVWAGVACYPAHAFDSGTLLEQACAALTSARDWNQDRIEVALAE